MSEQQLNVEQLNEVLTTPFADYLLVDYVTWANRGIRQAITISVKGVIYSGDLISGAKWCERQIEDANNTSNSEEAIDAITAYYTQLKNERYATPEEASSSISYFHMDNVRIASGGSLSDYSMLWRFKIGEIDGYAIGKLLKS
ncbi:hypothetical protein [Serratia liquefaciens]|uniref:hypothetical protein n=1 Tax=Serratia liquefaciens TaxID=614 RepID=UPI00165CF281|nr:hypothetical protein [Serratia liquefaciens]QNQ52298.1 hypothetical protein IAI46_13590 [Serratia liquefaciens]